MFEIFCNESATEVVEGTPVFPTNLIEAQSRHGWCRGARWRSTRPGWRAVPAPFRGVIRQKPRPRDRIAVPGKPARHGLPLSNQRSFRSHDSPGRGTRRESGRRSTKYHVQESQVMSWSASFCIHWYFRTFWCANEVVMTHVL